MPKFDNVSVVKRANVYFDIEPLETLDYVCHFG